MSFEGSGLVGQTMKAEETPATVSLMKKCACEAVGTFFLCATIALACGQGEPEAPLAIGFTLMVIIFAFGHISGGHFNPAVTFGVFLSGRDKIDIVTAGYYWAAQIVGAFISAGVCYGVAVDAGFPGGYPGVNEAEDVQPGVAFLVEMLYTFLLVIVVLNVATTKSQADNSFFGLAIGLTVGASAFAAGKISGACFNPAVGTALPAVHGRATDLWIYWLGPLSGSALAAGFFYLTSDANEWV